MNFASVSKAIAGALVGAVTSSATAVAITIPDGVSVPWYGYVLIAILNAGIGYVGVYLSPRNR